jgi:hypothetical protein
LNPVKLPRSGRCLIINPSQPSRVSHDFRLRIRAIVDYMSNPEVSVDVVLQRACELKRRLNSRLSPPGPADAGPRLRPRSATTASVCGISRSPLPRCTPSLGLPGPANPGAPHLAADPQHPNCRPLSAPRPTRQAGRNLAANAGNRSSGQRFAAALQFPSGRAGSRAMAPERLKQRDTPECAPGTGCETWSVVHHKSHGTRHTPPWPRPAVVVVIFRWLFINIACRPACCEHLLCV